MDDSFEIPVYYKGKELCFNAKLLRLGYIHKIQVDVNGLEVLFELDEERNYRAMVDHADINLESKIDIALIRAIAATLESFSK